ncbi:alginate export family protein [Prosthecobacter sp.]|uniref:alginate export family protein n=1 Tax=Prosthecobacter sp. TaxID=1965333 RepID=UPI0037842D13
MPPSLRAFLASLSLLLFAFAAPAAETAFKPVITRSTAANRIAEKPEYAHAFSNDVDWLEVGFESRTRYEVRGNDYTSALLSDDALVTRNLLYLGVKKALDPLRLVFELQDSRRFFSDLSANSNVSDTLEPLQAYAQLYFENAAGDAPLSLSFGRMAFDWADRRLISRNRNRNTISAFDGIRLRIGSENAPWEIDAIAVRPVTRSIQNLDQSTDDLMLYGLAAYWRGWSPHVVLEPYWLWLDQREAGTMAQRRNLHTLGLHAFGQWGKANAWDYDLSLAGQWGYSGGLAQRAYAGHAEAGYTWSTAWKPRLGLWLNYASGDSSATDKSNQRFDPLYGATYSFYGFSSYFSWQNIINPALRLSFQPVKTLKCEIIHRGIWLASSTDSWVKAGRRDATGSSGSYVGQELDLRFVWQLSSFFDIDFAYAHFFPGTFVKNTGAAPPGNFMQVAGTLRF